MKAFFEPSVTKIKHLLQEQIKKANFEMEDKKTVRVGAIFGISLNVANIQNRPLS